jgi:hypothetical protein
VVSRCPQVTEPAVRVWVGLVAVRSLAYAVAWRENADRLAGTEAFEVVEVFMGVRWVATMFFVIAVVAVGAYWDRREIYIRVVGIAVVGFQLLFGLAVLAAGSWSPAGVSMLAVAALDVLILSRPFHSRPDLTG